MCALFKSKKTAPLPRETMQAPELREAQLAAASYGAPTGGDFYDFVRVSPNRVLFGLLDVAGRFQDNHSIVAAARNTFRSRGAELFAQEDINEADAMIEICGDLNRTILKAAGRVCSSPAFAGCYNESLGTVCYFNAGHTPGLMGDDSGVTELGATGLPLGLFSHITPDASIVALQPGAALLVVSRGMVEARRKSKSSKSEEFGLNRVKDYLQGVHAQAAQEISATILSKVQEFMGKSPVGNDVTALALARASARKAFATG
jgi:sigma-B regulation protein RsbU (phosphoserine phosphatase)